MNETVSHRMWKSPANLVSLLPLKQPSLFSPLSVSFLCPIPAFNPLGIVAPPLTLQIREWEAMSNQYRLHDDGQDHVDGGDYGDY